MLVLGIESSCDDTAASVIRREADGGCAILSDVVRTDLREHAAFGGVVPEVAARAHVLVLDSIIALAVEQSGHTFEELAAVAATAGPGLIGGVMVGLTTAKAIAIAHDRPLIPINHLEGHALSVRMTGSVEFPYLLLLISGGHTQLIHVEGVGRYRRLGTTIDDAAGEAFDKSAKLLGLGQPGGPRIEAAARGGRAQRFQFPAPLTRRPGCDFSLSGLKTALRLAAEALDHPSKEDIADLAASFQAALARHLAARTVRSIEMLAREGVMVERLVAAGGVAANAAVREQLEQISEAAGCALIIPPAKYCTDNGAMIAWAGAERLASGLTPPRADALAFAPRPQWAQP
ncbi:MAG: tRNA (adenosine(37)-N6)-threonylcarbamoyltransferase complex transferase subunit TsaD, partial [Parvularculaceae bacterium]